jgi:hypothetical protein
MPVKKAGLAFFNIERNKLAAVDVASIDPLG